MKSQQPVSSQSRALFKFWPCQDANHHAQMTQHGTLVLAWSAGGGLKSKLNLGASNLGIVTSGIFGAVKPLSLEVSGAGTCSTGSSAIKQVWNE